jgi:hypothetical protein
MNNGVERCFDASGNDNCDTVDMSTSSQTAVVIVKIDDASGRAARLIHRCTLDRDGRSSGPVCRCDAGLLG